MPRFWPRKEEKEERALVPVYAVQTVKVYEEPAQKTDAEVIQQWLGNQTPRTRRAYAEDWAAFRSACDKPLAAIDLGDLQRFAQAQEDVIQDNGEPYAPATLRRRLSAIKSLLTFAQRLGHIERNMGAMLKLPKVPDELAARILDEAAIQRILALTADPYHHLVVRLLYNSGARREELAKLRWKDCQPREDRGQITVTGKGGKTRAILLSPTTWRLLMDWRKDAIAEAFVFPGRKKGEHVAEQTIYRIMQQAAAKAGIEADVSPHWMRHAHASHAMENGASIILVAETLGHADIKTTRRYAHARPGHSSGERLRV